MTPRRAPLAAVLLGLALVTSPAPCQTTQEPAAPAPPVAPADLPPPVSPAAEKPVGLRWKDGLSIMLGDHGHVDVKARFQLDAQASEGRIRDEADGEDASLDLARRRIGLEGELFGVIEFEVERELTGDQPWRDVFVNARPWPALQLQGGHFRLPFSLDATTGATNLDFVYRSLAARNLAPGRDPGVMLHGRLLPRRFLRYELGVFSQDGRNARTLDGLKVSGDTTIAGRLAVQPWRGRTHVLEDLHVAVASTISEVPLGVPALRGESVLGVVFAPSDTLALGPRRRTGVEARWRPGPFSIRSEYMAVTTAREGQSVHDTDLPPLLGQGWYVSGTWALTGERKARGLDRPRRPLLRGGVGAIEVAARVEGLEFRSKGSGEASTSPRAEVVPAAADRVLTVGLNWYLNRYVKVQVDVVRERFSDAARSPAPGTSVVLSQLFRVQFTL